MKSLRILGIGLLAVIPFLTMTAQKAMTPQDLQDWKRITTRAISDDGQWAAAVFTPWKGDSEVQLLSVDGKAVQTYTPASEVKFSSSYAIVKKVPADALMDELKLKKTKKDKMPMDELVIRNLKSGAEWSIDSLKGYRLAEEGDWLADEERFNDEDPLWFSETSHRVSPITILKNFENELKQAGVKAQTHIILVKTAGNIINAEDMHDVWTQMNVLVARSGTGCPVELPSFTQTFPAQLEAPTEEDIQAIQELLKK